MALQCHLCDLQFQPCRDQKAKLTYHLNSKHSQPSSNEARASTRLHYRCAQCSRWYSFTSGGKLHQHVCSPSNLHKSINNTDMIEQPNKTTDSPPTSSVTRSGTRRCGNKNLTSDSYRAIARKTSSRGNKPCSLNSFCQRYPIHHHDSVIEEVINNTSSASKLNPIASVAERTFRPPGSASYTHVHPDRQRLMRQHSASTITESDKARVTDPNASSSSTTTVSSTGGARNMAPITNPADSIPHKRPKLNNLRARDTANSEGDDLTDSVDKLFASMLRDADDSTRREKSMQERREKRCAVLMDDQMEIEHSAADLDPLLTRTLELTHAILALSNIKNFKLTDKLEQLIRLLYSKAQVQEPTELNSNLELVGCMHNKANQISSCTTSSTCTSISQAEMDSAIKLMLDLELVKIKFNSQSSSTLYSSTCPSTGQSAEPNSITFNSFAVQQLSDFLPSSTHSSFNYHGTLEKNLAKQGRISPEFNKETVVEDSEEKATDSTSPMEIEIVSPTPTSLAAAHDQLEFEMQTLNHDPACTQPTIPNSPMQITSVHDMTGTTNITPTTTSKQAQPAKTTQSHTPKLAVKLTRGDKIMAKAIKCNHCLALFTDEKRLQNHILETHNCKLNEEEPNKDATTNCPMEIEISPIASDSSKAASNIWFDVEMKEVSIESGLRPIEPEGTDNTCTQHTQPSTESNNNGSNQQVDRIDLTTNTLGADLSTETKQYFQLRTLLSDKYLGNESTAFISTEVVQQAISILMHDAEIQSNLIPIISVSVDATSKLLAYTKHSKIESKNQFIAYLHRARCTIPHESQNYSPTKLFYITCDILEDNHFYQIRYMIAPPTPANPSGTLHASYNDSYVAMQQPHRPTAETFHAEFLKIIMENVFTASNSCSYLYLNAMSNVLKSSPSTDLNNGRMKQQAPHSNNCALHLICNYIEMLDPKNRSIFENPNKQEAYMFGKLIYQNKNKFTREVLQKLISEDTQTKSKLHEELSSVGAYQIIHQKANSDCGLEACNQELMRLNIRRSDSEPIRKEFINRLQSLMKSNNACADNKNALEEKLNLYKTMQLQDMNNDGVPMSFDTYLALFQMDIPNIQIGQQITPIGEWKIEHRHAMQLNAYMVPLLELVYGVRIAIYTYSTLIKSSQSTLEDIIRESDAAFNSELAVNSSGVENTVTTQGQPVIRLLLDENTHHYDLITFRNKSVLVDSTSDKSNTSKSLPAPQAQKMRTSVTTSQLLPMIQNVVTARPSTSPTKPRAQHMKEQERTMTNNIVGAKQSSTPIIPSATVTSFQCSKNDLTLWNLNSTKNQASIKQSDPTFGITPTKNTFELLSENVRPLQAPPGPATSSMASTPIAHTSNLQSNNRPIIGASQTTKYKVPTPEQLANFPPLISSALMPTHVLEPLFFACKKQLLNLNEALVTKKSNEDVDIEFSKFLILHQIMLQIPSKRIPLNRSVQRFAHKLENNSDAFYTDFLKAVDQEVKRGKSTAVQKKPKKKNETISMNACADSPDLPMEEFYSDAQAENLIQHALGEVIKLQNVPYAVDLEELQLDSNLSEQQKANLINQKNELDTGILYNLVKQRELSKLTTINSEPDLFPPHKLEENRKLKIPQINPQTIRAVNRKIREGEVGRAMNLLTSKGIVKAETTKQTDSIMEKLAALHPDYYPSYQQRKLHPTNYANYSDYLFGEPTQPTTPPPFVDILELKKALKAADNGSAAGASGFGGKMLALLADDPDCLLVLHKLAIMITENKMPTKSSDLLRAVLSVALKKNEDAIRPISIGEALLNAVDRLHAHSISKAIEPTLSPNQMANVPGASEAALHNQQIKLELGIKDKLISLKLDIRKAYPTISREACRHALSTNALTAPFLPYFDFLYAHESTTVTIVKAKDGSITSIPMREGMPQGRPTSGPLFTFPIQIGLNKILKEHPQVTEIGIVDDTHLTGPVLEVEKVLVKFENFLNHELCMQLVKDGEKSQCLWLYGDNYESVPQDVRDFVARHNLLLVYRATKTLGGVIGLPRTALITSLGKEPNDSDQSAEDPRLKDVEAIFNELSDIFPYLLHPGIKNQAFLILLRYCVGSRTNFVLRTQPPSVVYKCLRDYNTKLLNLFCQRFRFTSLSSLQVAQLSNRLGAGGFGLQSLSPWLSPCAYVASFLQVVPYQADTLTMVYNKSISLPATDELMTAVTWIRHNAFSHISDPQQRQQQIDTLLPATLPQIYAKYRNLRTKSLQHRLTSAFDTAKFQAMLNDSATPAADKARLIDLCAPYTSAWAQVFPSRKELQLSDSETEMAVRLRIGKPACEANELAPGLECAHCGFKIVNDTYHPIYCLANRSTLRARQHNEYNLILKQVIEASYGGRVSIEPNLYADKDYLAGARPDNLIVLNSSVQVCTDVTIRYVASPSYIASGAALHLGKVVQEAEKAKVKKHLQRANQAGYQYSTIGLSCNGGVGRSALELFSKIQFEADNSLANQPLVSIMDRSTGCLARADSRNREVLLSEANTTMCNPSSQTHSVVSSSGLSLDPKLNAPPIPPVPDPPPNTVLDPSVAENLDLRPNADYCEIESKSFEDYLLKINPKSSIFFNLINYGAISVQRGNARAIQSDLSLARIKHLNKSNLISTNTIMQSALTC